MSTSGPLMSPPMNRMFCKYILPVFLVNNFPADYVL